MSAVRVVLRCYEVHGRRPNYSAGQLVPARRFAIDLQDLIDMVDYRARRSRTCPVDVWVDLRFRSRDLQDSLGELTATLRVACAYLDVYTQNISRQLGGDVAVR
jgi:hypothetical protein